MSNVPDTKTKNGSAGADSANKDKAKKRRDKKDKKKVAGEALTTTGDDEAKAAEDEPKKDKKKKDERYGKKGKLKGEFYDEELERLQTELVKVRSMMRFIASAAASGETASSLDSSRNASASTTAFASASMASPLARV